MRKQVESKPKERQIQSAGRTVFAYPYVIFAIVFIAYLPYNKKSLYCFLQYYCNEVFQTKRRYLK